MTRRDNKRQRRFIPLNILGLSEISENLDNINKSDYY